MNATTPCYYECGICNHYHPANWDGDCRDDENRLTFDQIEAKHGPDGWDEVPMPDTGEPIIGKGFFHSVGRPGNKSPRSNCR
jgi:hypothetical protein